jgi:RNase adaptor protein for sRNA GlmZ degradation
VPLTLAVRIESFTYKNGYPPDESGHGGGFVFDCRSLPNPAREAPFARATGCDSAVATWLEQYHDVAQFLHQIEVLLTPVIESYQKRNFTHLTIAFGCTGGQHRSVYCAEQLARHFRARGGVAVDVHHREAANWPGAAEAKG